MRCTYHPDVETNLGCGKCGKPICPKCMVQTPVGARCRECAKLYRLPTYNVSIRYYLRAVGAGIGMGVFCGIVWAGITYALSFYYLNLLLAAGAGYAIGEIISLSVNRKRGTGLATIGGVSVSISYLFNLWFLSFLLSVPFIPFLQGLDFINIILGLIALALGIYVAITRLR